VRLTSWLIRLVAALAGGVMATVVQAAPLMRAAPENIAISHHERNVAPVASRRCWRENGRRHCRSSAYDRYNSDYYVRDADKLPFGTSVWWEEMLRENRAGNPGGGGKN